MMIIFLLALTLVSANDALAVRGRYEIGDWVSWTSMREVNDIEEYGNVLYVASDGGIARYDLISHRWKAPLTVADGLADERITAIHFDPATGDLIYRTRRGLFSFSLLTERNNPWFRPTDEDDRSVTPPTPPGSLPNFHPPPGYHSDRGILIDEYLREYPIIDQVRDFWGNTWLGIRGLGVAVIEWNTAVMRLLTFSLWNDDLRAMARQGDLFWFVGPAAINVYDRRRERWRKFEAFQDYDLKSDDVRDAVIGSTYVWLATSEGVSRYDRRTGGWRTFDRFDGLPDKDVRALAADTGFVWVGTRFGMARITRRRSLVTDVSHGGFAERSINAVAVTDTTVWAGTNVGLWRSDDRGTTWRRFTGGEPILDASVYVIAADGRELWCATRLGVIGYDTERHTAERFPAGTYFGGDSIGGVGKRVYSLLAADSLLWVGTAEGVYRYDRRRGYWRTFTTEDGLIDNRVRDIVRDGDYLWFATPRGVTRFYWNDPYRID